MKNIYKFIIPLFALAFLLVSCTPASSTPDSAPPDSPMAATAALKKARTAFDGTMLTGKHTVVLHTSKGDITLELDADAAPKTVTNFVELAKAGYYDKLTFHRVIPDFMIQGGDPNGQGTGGESIYGPEFEDEINANSYGLDKQKMADVAQGEPLPPECATASVKECYEKHDGYKYNDALTSLPMVKGAIAMANRGPATNGSQFFIVERAEVSWLNGRHTVFGNVTAGQDVVDAIAAVERDGRDKPLTPVTYTVEVKS